MSQRRNNFFSKRCFNNVLVKSQPSRLWQQFTIISIFDVLNNFIKKSIKCKVQWLHWSFVHVAYIRSIQQNRETFLLQKSNHNFLRSQSTDFGKDTICCSIEGPLSFVDRTLEFCSVDNKNTKIANYVYPRKLTSITHSYLTFFNLPRPTAATTTATA